MPGFRLPSRVEGTGPDCHYAVVADAVDRRAERRRVSRWVGLQDRVGESERKSAFGTDREGPP